MGNNMGPLNKQYTRIEVTNDKENYVVRVLRYYTVDVLGESEEHYEVIDLPYFRDENKIYQFTATEEFVDDIVNYLNQ